MAASLTTAAVNSNFVIVVRCVEDQKTIDGLLSPTPTADDPRGSNPDSWSYLTALSDFFGAASAGGHSVNVAYADGGSTGQATNTLTFSANPANNDTITIAGVLVTLVTGTPSGSQVKIGATQAATMTNIVTFINAGGNAGNIAGVCAAVQTGTNVITLYALSIGVGGNLLTLAKSSTAISVGGATFSGGAGVGQGGPLSAGI